MLRSDRPLSGVLRSKKSSFISTASSSSSFFGRGSVFASSFLDLLLLASLGSGEGVLLLAVVVVGVYYSLLSGAL